MTARHVPPASDKAAPWGGLDLLFGSRALVKILELLVLNPARSFYLRQIAAATDLPVNAVTQQLAKLEQMRLVTARADGNRKYFQIDQAYPIFPELKSILLKLAAVGEVLKRFLEKRKESIRAAFIFGSAAAGGESRKSDIDLFIVGNLSLADLYVELDKLSKDILRPINPSLFTEAGLRRKLARKDHFVRTVLKGPKIFLIGNEDEMARIAG
jgi:predicted nucleotidyltransferase